MAFANQRYNEYRKNGGNLSFKEWINISYDSISSKDAGQYGKNVIGDAKPTTDTLTNTIQNLHKTAGLKTGLENKYIFGIPRGALIFSGIVLVVGISAFVVLKKKK